MLIGRLLALTIYVVCLTRMQDLGILWRGCNRTIDINVDLREVKN